MSQNAGILALTFPGFLTGFAFGMVRLAIFANLNLTVNFALIITYSMLRHNMAI